MRGEFKQIKSVMIVDLSAQQGNGLGRDFIDDQNVNIFDMYNRNIYPGDEYAKKGIRRYFLYFCMDFFKESSIFKENLFFTKVYVIAIFIPSQ